jgi:hypothetical protein
MLTFKQFLKEEKIENDSSYDDEPMELTTNIDIFDDDHINEMLLVEAISSNDKGVLHELLTGYHLGGRKHMSPEAKNAHDQIKKKISRDEYNHANKLAQRTATHIRGHFKNNVQSVHWSSKPGDIGRITGTHETQQQNPSDIIIRHNDGSHTGLSLKVTKKKNGKVPVGNPGAKQTDAQLGVSTSHHYEKARQKLRSQFKELKSSSNKEMKTAIKSNPEMRKAADEHSAKAIRNIRNTWFDSLSKMSTKKLSDHLRNNLLHAKTTKTKMFKVTTGGHADDSSVEIEHPATSHDHILRNHRHITVEKSGNNSIVFKHKGKVFLRHRIKPESTPLATPLKGSAE